MARRTTIEVDEQLLDAARQVLGTRGLKDTVDRALSEIVRAHRRRELAEQLHTGEGIDRGDAVLSRSREWRR